MLAIEEDLRTLVLTRGDKTSEYNRIAFYYPIYNHSTEKEENYVFKPSDKITLIINTKKGYTKTKVLEKTYLLSEIGFVEETEYPEIVLTPEDTNLFDLADKPVTYYYEVVLNDYTTILGHDNEEGAARLIVLPSGKGIF
jgi:hypothetical protein